MPSLPGSGFSGPTSSTGWNVSRIARAWAALMAELGYQRYGAAGNDWGSYVAPELGRVAPDHVVGVHVTQLFAQDDDVEIDGPTDEDKAVLAGLQWARDNMDAYSRLQAQQPQTLAYALADSPVGLLAWHAQIYRGGVDADFVLTNVAVHWLTGTVGSAMRIYREYHLTPPATTPTTVPLALAQFSHDYRPFRRIAHREHANIVSWNDYDSPGHFAARQSPDLLVADLRDFFSGRR